MTPRFLVPCLLVACGSGGSAQDAGGPDAQGEPDATPCVGDQVNVVVYSPYEIDTTPLEGIDVIATDPQGQVIARDVTDSAGTVALEVPSGSSVSILRRDPADYVYISTIHEVESCDVLVFGAIYATPEVVPGNERMAVQLAPHGGGGVYGVHNGCTSVTFSSELEGTIDSVPSCSPGPHDYLALAIGQYGLLATAVAEDQPFVDGGTVVIPDNWTQPAEVEVRVIGMPPGTGNVSVYYDSVNEGLIYPFVSGAGMDSPGTDATLAIQTPDFGATGRIRTAFWGQFSPTSMGARDLIPVGKDFLIDVADFVPLIESREFLPETREIRWATSPFGDREPDGAYGSLSFRVGTTNYYWRAIGPATGSMRLPTLPPDLDPGGFDLPSLTITLYESSDLADYRAFRATGDRDAELRFNMVGLAERQRTSIF